MHESNKYLGCPRDVLQEERQILPAERSHNIPEPLYLLVSGLEVRVLRVVLSRHNNFKSVSIQKGAFIPRAGEGKGEGRREGGVGSSSG